MNLKFKLKLVQQYTKSLLRAMEQINNDQLIFEAHYLLRQTLSYVKRKGFALKKKKKLIYLDGPAQYV